MEPPSSWSWWQSSFSVGIHSFRFYTAQWRLNKLSEIFKSANFDDSIIWSRYSGVYEYNVANERTFFRTPTGFPRFEWFFPGFLLENHPGFLKPDRFVLEVFTGIIKIFFNNFFQRLFFVVAPRLPCKILSEFLLNFTKINFRVISP